MKTLAFAFALCLLGTCMHSHFFATLYFLAGAIWGLINLYFLQQLFYHVLIKKPKNLLKILLTISIKFPILYTVGFGFLYFHIESAWILLTGFSSVLIFRLFLKPSEIKMTFT